MTTVKEFFAPSTFKPGSIFNRKDVGKAMLCRVDAKKCCLVAMEGYRTGDRCRNPISVENVEKITQEEIQAMTCYEVQFADTPNYVSLGTRFWMPGNVDVFRLVCGMIRTASLINDSNGSFIGGPIEVSDCMRVSQKDLYKLGVQENWLINE